MSRGLGDVYKRQILTTSKHATLDSLMRLEKMEKVVSGMDGDIKVWQAKT